MSLPPAPIPLGMASGIGMAAINPIEHIFMGLNTNPYFIGLMMLLLNLGGRFIGLEVSRDQEKFFQHPYVRRALIFTVLFVATRNVLVAAIMTIFVLLVVSYLFNENSSLCLWKTDTKPKEVVENFSQLTPEESEILKRLLDKQTRVDVTNKNLVSKDNIIEKPTEVKQSPEAVYSMNINKLQQ